MHWPYPPNPNEYQSLGMGLVMGMFALVVIFLVVVFYATKSNAPLLHKPEPELDETGPEEKEPK